METSRKQTPLASLPPFVDVSPSELAERARQRMVPIGSVWFPSRAELARWEGSGLSLYVRRLNAETLEIGPRTASMWAACFSPVHVARMTPGDSGTRLSWSRRLPRFTRAIVVMWWIALAVWAAAIVSSASPEASNPGNVLFWSLLALSATAGVWVGVYFGGRELDEATPALIDFLVTPDLGEDW